MLTRTHLARTVRWAIVWSCLSVAPSYAGDQALLLAQAETDVEMSAISGDAASPRRHFRLRDPKFLDAERAAEIYAIASAAMAVGYPLSGSPVARDYQNWRRYNSAPYLSATHGNHYLNNYANQRALAYGERRGRVPELMEHKTVERSSVEAGRGAGPAPDPPESAPPHHRAPHRGEHQPARLHRLCAHVLSQHS